MLVYIWEITKLNPVKTSTQDTLSGKRIDDTLLSNGKNTRSFDEDCIDSNKDYDGSNAGSPRNTEKCNDRQQITLKRVEPELFIPLNNQGPTSSEDLAHYSPKFNIDVERTPLVILNRISREPSMEILHTPEPKLNRLSRKPSIEILHTPEPKLNRISPKFDMINKISRTPPRELLLSQSTELPTRKLSKPPSSYSFSFSSLSESYSLNTQPPPELNRAISAPYGSDPYDDVSPNILRTLQPPTLQRGMSAPYGDVSLDIAPSNTPQRMQRIPDDYDYDED